MLREALITIPGLRDYSIEIRALRVAGMLAAVQGDAERAALLFGAAEGKLRESGLELFGPFEEQLCWSYAERARLDLGESRFEAFYKRGMEEQESIGSELAVPP